MSKTKNFTKYFNHLLEYQNQLLPDNKLNRDYIIIYDYLMDLLQKDEIIAEFLVRKKQQVSSINADILLDLTKGNNVHSYLHETFLCLALQSRDNGRSTIKQHPFCNKKNTISSEKITRSIWSALHKGLFGTGSFVRGYQGDIYELSLSSVEHCESDIRINAYNEDVSLNINLRILIKYVRNYTRIQCKPQPSNELTREWFALVPRRVCSMFEISLPHLENELKHVYFKLVMIYRLLRFLFEKHKQLKHIEIGFLEAIIYIEYMHQKQAVKKEIPGDYDYIFTSVITRIYKAFKTKKCPTFWNERLNIVRYFDNFCLVSTMLSFLNDTIHQYNSLKKKKSLTYNEFFDFFDFKMDPFSYEVDQFGIFKSY